MALFAKIRAQINEYGGVWLKHVAVVLSLGLILFVAFGGVSHNKRWQINSINIVRSVIVPADDIREFVWGKILGNYYFVYARDNSYIFPKQEIEKTILEKFPRIENASVTRTDENTISVFVSERKPYVLWCGNKLSIEQSSLPKCWFADRGGYVFDHAPVFSPGVYLEVYGELEKVNEDNPIGGVIPRTHFDRLNNLVRALRADVGEPLRVILEPEGEFDIIMRSGIRYTMLSGVSLKLKDDVAPTILIKTLNIALEKEFPGGTALKKRLLYIDLRFGNKIFFGF